MASNVTNITVFEYRRLLKKAYQDFFDVVILPAMRAQNEEGKETNERVFHLTIFCFMRALLPSTATQEKVQEIASQYTDHIKGFEMVLEKLVVSEEDINENVLSILRGR